MNQIALDFVQQVQSATQNKRLRTLGEMLEEAKKSCPDLLLQITQFENLADKQIKIKFETEKQNIIKQITEGGYVKQIKMLNENIKSEIKKVNDLTIKNNLVNKQACQVELNNLQKQNLGNLQLQNDIQQFKSRYQIEKIGEVVEFLNQVKEKVGRVRE